MYTYIYPSHLSKPEKKTLENPIISKSYNICDNISLVLGPFNMSMSEPLGVAPLHTTPRVSQRAKQECALGQRTRPFSLSCTLTSGYKHDLLHPLWLEPFYKIRPHKIYFIRNSFLMNIRNRYAQCLIYYGYYQIKITLFYTSLTKRLQVIPLFNQDLCFQLNH